MALEAFHLHISYKATKSMANLSASHAMNYSWLSACPGEMEPFKDHPIASTHGHLTSLRNKPQQKQPGQPSLPIPAWIVS